jgi:hypothetical protein
VPSPAGGNSREEKIRLRRRAWDRNHCGRRDGDFHSAQEAQEVPKNARKTPHSESAIKAYAVRITAKGLLQNLVVEPELDADDTATGFYFVTIGEGRRLAQLLRVKRKEIKKTEPIRCIVDTANDPHEISLDENLTRENMHPADQLEAFKKLAEGTRFRRRGNRRPLRRNAACDAATPAAGGRVPETDAGLSR